MKPISFQKLQTLLGKFEIEVDPSRGKGSHRLLVDKSVDRRKCFYPVP